MGYQLLNQLLGPTKKGLMPGPSIKPKEQDDSWQSIAYLWCFGALVLCIKPTPSPPVLQIPIAEDLWNPQAGSGESLRSFERVCVRGRERELG